MDMSDQQPIRNNSGTPTESAVQDTGYNNVDKTQPSEDILNALNALNPKAVMDATQNGHEPSLVQDGASQETAQDPPSEWHVLRGKLCEHSQDPEGWNQLVDIAENGGDLEQIKQTYEAVLETYPNTVWPPAHFSTVNLTVLSQVIRPNRLSRPLPEPRFIPVRRRIVQEIFENFALSRSLEVLSYLCQVRRQHNHNLRTIT